MADESPVRAKLAALGPDAIVLDLSGTRIPRLEAVPAADLCCASLHAKTWGWALQT